MTVLGLEWTTIALLLATGVVASMAVSIVTAIFVFGKREREPLVDRGDTYRADRSYQRE